MKTTFTTAASQVFLTFLIAFGFICIPESMHAKSNNLTGHNSRILINPGAAGNFITTWKTDIPGISDGNQITIPTEGDDYNYEIYWEDATNANVNGTVPNVTGSYTITFPAPGTYKVEIAGSFPRIYFNNTGDKDKILSVEQWGNIQWTSMASAFRGAGNLRITATDAPDLSGVTTLENMFQDAAAMNDPIGHWDVSHVEGLYAMFYDAASFNQDLSSWDVSNVRDMSNVFTNAVKFNGNVSNWIVSNATQMYGTFEGARAFNQDLSGWNVGKVTTMDNMFSGAIIFNGNISGWNVSNVTSMNAMFYGASSFNGNINGWNVSNVTTMNSMFYSATGFNRSLTGWIVSKVTNMNSMFLGASSFNGDISNWNVSKVTNMNSMFFAASSFNGNISGWNVSNVTSMSSMFFNAVLFNTDLKNWNVAKVAGMSRMFQYATAFDQNLGQWNVSGAMDMTYLFLGSGLSSENYEATLVGWAERSDLKSNVTVGADGLRFCTAEAARARLISEFNWVFTGDRKDPLCNSIVTPGEGNILYVDKNVAGGDHTGSSWANALPELADAMHWARLKWERDGSGSGWGAGNPLKIYVASGTYLPGYQLDMLEAPSVSERSYSFITSPHTQLYGGFDPQNNISNLSHQRIMPFMAPGNSAAGGGTILSGNLGDQSVSTDNAYHVMVSLGFDGAHEFLMDGFKITQGNASGGDEGEGDPYFSVNTGGAGFLSIESNLKMKNVAIVDNHAGQEGVESGENGVGGGMYSSGGFLDLTDMIFSGNSSLTYAGGLCTSGGAGSITNVIFTGNSAPNGAAITTVFANTVLTNVTISGNKGPALYNLAGLPVIRNSIIWGNSESIVNIQEVEEMEVEGEVAIFNSIVEGGYAGTNVSDVNPQFVDNPGFAAAPFVNGNYTLRPGSRAVNAGDPLTNSDGYAVQAGRTDVAGNSRIFGDYIVDLGAYELNCFVQLAADGTSTTQNLNAGPNFLYNACSLFAVVEPTGETSPVAGSIVARAWLKNNILTYREARYVRRHYDLTPASGGENATADITLLYTQADFDAYNTAYGTANASQLPVGPEDQLPGNIRIAQFRGGYTVAGQSVTPGTSITYIVPKSVVWNAAYSIWEVTIGVNGFSGFFMTGQNDAALPVTLVNFDAKKQEQNILLTWKTTIEINASHFEIERSSDSKIFTAIGQLDANGESVISSSYRFLDLTSGTSPTLYYRLKMVDLDGTFAYSRIVAVKNENGVDQLTFNVYPNPSKGQINLTTAGIGTAEVSVYNLLGGEVSVKAKSISEGRIQLNLHGQPAGIYTVVIRQAGNIITKKIVLE